MDATRHKPTLKAAPPRRKKQRSKMPRARHTAGLWKTKFLATLMQTANVSRACKVAKVNRQYVYEARSVNDKAGDALREAEAFARAWDEAIEIACDSLEQEAWRRGRDGVLEPVFGSGGTGKGTIEVGHVRKYSDQLLMFLLRGHRAARFRENVNVSGNLGLVQIAADELAKAKDAAAQAESELLASMTHDASHEKE